MKLNLQIKSFSFFKIVTGFLFLSTAVFFPAVAAGSFFIALIVGRAHSFGAWLAMWRAGKLNYTYVISMFVLIMITSYWGFFMVSLIVLAFVANVLFAFHFLYDEFDLQQEKRSISNIISSLTPSIIIFIFLCKDFFNLSIPFSFFVYIAITLLLIELIYIKEISWFFIQSKIITIFILLSMFFGAKAREVLAVFLILHYFFWFVYPVYNLHKYKREERDGFIMILLLIVAGAAFYGFTQVSHDPEVLNYNLKGFYVGTIVHIFSTAPFGYFFGLPKPKYLLES